MSGYSYGHSRSGAAAAARYAGRAAAAASQAYSPAVPRAAANGHQSVGEMAYPHIPAINESSDFVGNFAADPYHSYQRPTQNNAQRMAANIQGDNNRAFMNSNMDGNGFNNQHFNAGMQAGYSSGAGSTPSRRGSVPANVGVNSYGPAQRSHSFPNSADAASSFSNRSGPAAMQSSYQPHFSSQNQQFGENFNGYNAQNHPQSVAFSNRPSGMVKSNEMWERANANRMGTTSFSNAAMNSHFPHKTATNPHFQSGTSYPASQTNPSQMYSGGGMHSSMEMGINNDSALPSSDFGVQVNRGHGYSGAQALYNTTHGGRGTRNRVPNQRTMPGNMYSGNAPVAGAGTQMPGAMQKLRHYGPMPNSSSGYARTNTSNMRQNNVPHHGNSMPSLNSDASAGVMQSGWQSNSGFSQFPQNQSQVANTVPFTGLPHQSNMQQQQQHQQQQQQQPPMNYNNNMYGVSSRQQQTTRNYSGTMPSNAVIDNTAAAPSNGLYGQTGRMAAPAAQFPAAVCPEKVDPSSMSFPGNLTAVETEAMMAQLNQDRIFSAELEKLARLSRNPTSEDFINEASAAASVTTSAAGGVMKASCSSESDVQACSTIDDLLDGGSCVVSMSSEPSHSTTSTTNLQSPCTSLQGGGSSAPFQPGSGGLPQLNQDNAACSSAPQTPNSGNMNPGGMKPTQSGMAASKKREGNQDGDSKPCQGGKNSDGQNSVQHLQRMTQSIKDSSKQDELMKVASSQHAEYLSHSASDNYGSQNCIAALSAACRNIIADMDSSLPKQNSGQKVQSPLGSKANKFDSAGFGPKSEGVSMFGSGPPSVASLGDQFIAPSSCMMTSAPNCVPMDSFSAFPTNYNGASPMPMPDFQGKYQDFLEQSVPMQMGGRRPEEKPRKGRRRRKSEEFSSDQLMPCNLPPAKPKRKYRKRSAQNPPSVESMEGPLSVDNVVFTPLSESSSHHADDIGYRSATQTPNSVPNSWGMDGKMSCSDSISIAMSIADGNQMEHVSQDLLDSVFSPDTTMSSTTNQEIGESGGCGVVQGSSPIIPSPHGAPHLNNNHPGSGDHKLLYAQSNNTVSSTGDANCPYISTTATHTVNGSTAKPKDVEEAHPLEILQAQIRIQRKQFNLGDTQQLQSSTPAKNTARKYASESAGGALPNVLDRELLTSDETGWYLSEDLSKDAGLWEDLCPKGQTNASSKPLLLAMQS